MKLHKVNVDEGRLGQVNSARVTKKNNKIEATSFVRCCVVHSLSSLLERRSFSLSPTEPAIQGNLERIG